MTFSTLIIKYLLASPLLISSDEEYINILSENIPLKCHLFLAKRKSQIDFRYRLMSFTFLACKQNDAQGQLCSAKTQNRYNPSP